MRKILFTTLLLLAFPIIVHAQQDTTTEELAITSNEVKAAEIEELEQQDEERTQEIANLLGFVLPEYTDNPSYVITFKDPSPDSQGVEADIDGGSFKKISSPYTLPALSIGQHTIKFRFYDKDSNVQLLEYTLVIIPRTPIISSPDLKEDSITISGTALANSEIIYTLTANALQTLMRMEIGVLQLLLNLDLLMVYILLWHIQGSMDMQVIFQILLPLE